MALQIWLPLNGNLDNQGLRNYTVTNVGGATVENTGKIGKCYKFNPEDSQSGTKYLQIEAKSSDFLQSGQSFSLACFFKVTGDTYSNGSGLISCVSYRDTGFSLMYTQAKKLSVQLSFGGSEREWTNLTGVLSADRWYHACFTYNQEGKQLSLYLDGDLTYQGTETMDWKVNTSIKIRVGCGTQGGWGYTFPGLMNDVRIYDHCLSAKEVKDISKGLVMHYKLNMPNPNLLPVSSQRMTENGQTSTNEYLNICSIFNIVETYGLVPLTISFDIKAAVDHGFSLYGNYGTGNKYMFTSKTIQVSTEWQRITYTFTPWLQNESGTWAGISVYGVYGSGAIVSVRRVKLELGTKATPFETGFNVATDCSGYKNHGIVSSTRIESIPNSPKHSTALKLGYNTYINAGTGAKVKDAVTVSCWASMSNWSSFSNMRLISCTEGGGWNFEPSSTKMNFACGTGVSSNTYKSVATVTPFASMSSGWHHFVGTYDGFKTKIYLDGVLENTNNAYTTKTPLYYNANNSILIGAEAQGGATPAGSYFVSGGLSDIRVYATALSEEDIKELYETSAFTDDKGTIDAYDFVERRLSIANEDVPDLDSTGVLHTKSFIEHTTLDAMIFKDRVEASRFVEI